ncbi:MAG: ABC transporter permease [Chloroflexota bacterium]
MARSVAAASGRNTPLLLRPGTLLPIGLLLPGVVILLAVFVAPVGRALGLSLEQLHGGQGLQWYARFFTSPSYRVDLWFTMWTSTLTVVLCAAVALPIALVLRGGGWVAGPLYVAILVPLLVPHLIAAYALRLTLSQNGPVAAALTERWHLLPGAPELVNQWSGLVVALVWKFFPVMTLTLLSGLESIPMSLHEAARDLGAGWLRRLSQVTVPLLIPGLLAGGVLIFILAASQFSVTLVMYGSPKVTTIPLDIYFLTFGQNQYPYGSAVGIVFTAVTLILLAATTSLVRRASQAKVGRATG